MNKRGENEAPSTFGGATLEILVIILMVYVSFMIIKAALFPEGEQVSLKNFEGLVNQVKLLLANKEPFAAVDQYAISLEDEYTIIGFNKDQDVYETCGEVIEKVNKPADCGSRACLCLYKDEDSNNRDFNDNTREGDNTVILCQPIEADYFFSHPYGIIRTEYPEYNLDPALRILPTNLFEGVPSSDEQAYYSISHNFDDYLRNFRGYLFQGPQGFKRHNDKTYLDLINNKVVEQTIPGQGGDQDSTIPEKIPFFLNYFEDTVGNYNWCMNNGYTEKKACLAALETAGQGNIEKANKKHLSGIYSSFVLYGECEGTEPAYEDEEWDTGSIHIEKYKNPDNGITAIFIGLKSPYTLERTKVMSFFNGKEDASGEPAKKFEGEIFDLSSTDDFIVNTLKINQKFQIKDYNGKGLNTLGEITSITTDSDFEDNPELKMTKADTFVKLNFGYRSAGDYAFRQYNFERGYDLGVAKEAKEQFFAKKYGDSASQIYAISGDGAKFHIAVYPKDKDTAIIGIGKFRVMKTASDLFIDLTKPRPEIKPIFEPS